MNVIMKIIRDGCVTNLGFEVEKIIKKNGQFKTISFFVFSLKFVLI